MCWQNHFNILKYTHKEKPLRKSSKHFLILQRAAGGGIAVWMDLLNGLLRAAWTGFSRRRREPDPLPIRHVWLYMKWVDFSVNMSGTAIIDTITVSGKNLRRFFNVKFIYIVNESLHDDEFHLSKRLFPNLKSGGNKCEK